MGTVLGVVITSAQLAALYGLVALAVVFSFRIANFADLTMDGSFTLGGAVSAVALLAGASPLLALICGVLVGAFAGIVTALLHTRIGINRLLAGIITMTLLYSINLRVMGRSNVSVLDLPSIFNQLGSEVAQLIYSVIGVLVIGGLAWLFLRTDLGNFMRAAGENPRVVVRKGYSQELLIILALFLSNGMAALAGGLITQYQGFADISMGVGIVIAALTALLLGEAILPPRSVPRLLGAALLGAFIYQIVVAVGLRIGINPWDLKLVMGILLIIVLALKHYTRRWRREAENIGSNPL